MGIKEYSSWKKMHLFIKKTQEELGSVLNL
jgi:hypothetical protein